METDLQKLQLVWCNLHKLIMYPKIYKMEKGEIRYGDKLAKTKVILKCPPKIKLK